MGDGVVVRRATDDDDAGIRQLLGESFAANPKARAEVLRWQYWDNPFGSVRSWVAEDDRRIVAHYAGVPMPAQLAGDPVTVTVGVDAATATTHRGRGLFERLARAVYDDCECAGMALTVCFPNSGSLRGFEKAGGSMVGRARALVLALDDDWVARRFHLPRVVTAGLRRLAFTVGDTREIGGSSVGEESEPPAGLDGLWQRVAPTASASVTRASAWWRWRYEDHPVHRYRYLALRCQGRLAGAAVVLQRDRFGGRFDLVLELLAEDAGAARSLVGAIAVSARSAGSVGVATVALPDTAAWDLARAGGLRPLPGRLEPVPLHVGLVDHRHHDRHHWDLWWGDLDHL